MILKADPEYKRKIQKVAVIILLGAGVLAYFGPAAFVSFMKTKKTEDGFHILLWLQALLFAQFILWAVYIVYKGKKVLAIGQYPLPGAKVIRDTPVVVGKAAQTRAKVAIGVGGAIAFISAFCAIYFTYALHKEFHRSLNKSNYGRQTDSAKKPALPLRP